MQTFTKVQQPALKLRRIKSIHVVSFRASNELTANKLHS